MVSIAAFHAKVGGSFPGIGGLKETKLFLPHSLVKLSIVGSLCDREVACSASDLQGLNFEYVSGGQCHLTQLTILRRDPDQFSLYVHKSGLKPDSFHFYVCISAKRWTNINLHNAELFMFKPWRSI